jgi:iron-sulfur cluster assembly protein
MITVTEPAADRIRQLLVKEGVPVETGGLRLGVQGGGCSGLTYAMRLEPQARERDQVVEAYGARIFVDPKSFVYLDNITLDFQVTLMRQGFVFQNPQAARTCGCGTSFTV